MHEPIFKYKAHFLFAFGKKKKGNYLCLQTEGAQTVKVGFIFNLYCLITNGNYVRRHWEELPLGGKFGVGNRHFGLRTAAAAERAPAGSSDSERGKRKSWFKNIVQLPFDSAIIHIIETVKTVLKFSARLNFTAVTDCSL